MKSLGVAALVVIASWCASCENVSAQAPSANEPAASTSADRPAATDTSSAGGAASGTAMSGTPIGGSSATPGMPPVPKPPVPSPSAEQAVVNQGAANNAHLSTPGGEVPTTSFPALRQFLEDSQNAHDKMIVDRFLIGVAILFAVIAAALLFSLPPKPREQKE